jgi:hypothetical protein
LLSRRYNAPCAPAYDEQALFIHAEKDVHDVSKPPLMDWERYVCLFRTAFEGVVIFTSDDGICTTGYRFLYAKQKPYTSTFLEVRRKHLNLPDPCCPDWVHIEIPPPAYCEFEFLSPTTFLVSKELPFGVGNTLWVLRDTFVDGNLVVSQISPVPFEVFVHRIDDLTTQKVDRGGPSSGKPSLSKDARLRLLAEFPWLTEDDFKMMSSRAQRKSQSESRKT